MFLVVDTLLVVCRGGSFKTENETLENQAAATRRGLSNVFLFGVE